LSESPPPPSGGGRGDVDYGTYLRLPELLALQTPLSRPEHPDELLFIVVHQSSELWFKCLLHELRGLADHMAGGATMFAVLSMRRVNALMRIVEAQLSALDTLPPQHFAQFRGYLGSSSGSQSLQYRTLEAASGLRDPHFLQAVAEHGEAPAPVREALARPRLEELFYGLLEREGISDEALYTGPAPTPLFLLAEELLEYDHAFSRWRFAHVQLVERIIGPGTGGTGGTLGARYLARTVSLRFFPRLWETRGKFFTPPS
jgi:tryptophan 2,3-dioxygenase